MGKLHNLARVQSSTVGTGALTLGPAVSGFLTFADAGVVNNDEVYYAIRDGDESEVGLGTYTSAGPTLARTTLHGSTHPAGQAITCSGNQEVFITTIKQTWEASLPKAPCMWHDQSKVTAGNALATVMDTQQPYAHVVFQNAAALNDTFKNSFICLAGTYTFNALVTKDTSRGIMTAYIDDVSIGTVDLYAASTTRNQIVTIGSVVISDGYHTFKGVAASKNASSSGYILSITKMWFTPTSY